MKDGVELAERLGAMTKAYIAREIEPLRAALASLSNQLADFRAMPGPRGEAGEKGAPGEKGDNGRDGVGVAEVSINQAGDLIVIFTDGKTMNAGRVIGADGRPGADGKDGKDGKDGAPGERGERGEPGERGERGEPGERGERGEPGERGERGERGAPGPQGVGIVDAATDQDGCLLLTLSNGDIIRTKSLRGADGLGFDDLSFEQPDERTTRLIFRRGDRIKTHDIVSWAPIYREIYSPGASYRRGDSVTYGGSLWIALRDTNEQPDGSDAWRLAVKRGRDGKPGKDGEKGERGPEGRPGRDLTQMGPDGAKW